MKQYLEKRGIYITWSQLVMRIIFDLVGFLLALLPAGLTLYLTDVWITSGTHMPTSWILGIIVCVFLIHFYQFYFVNYNSQMNADRMAGNYRQHLAQKILSSSIPAYESQNKARIQNMANDISAIYTVSSYLVTVPANLVKVIIIIGLLLFYASPSVALTAIILIPLYMVPSFLNKSELERLVAKEREAGDLWFQEFDVILNGKVSITLNKVENYMQNRYNEALKSYALNRDRTGLQMAFQSKIDPVTGLPPHRHSLKFPGKWKQAVSDGHPHGRGSENDSGYRCSGTVPKLSENLPRKETGGAGAGHWLAQSADQGSDDAPGGQRAKRHLCDHQSG